MPSPRASATTEGGFTLVEVLVAMFILLVGLLGTVALLDGANASGNAAATRVGASNLARQITERAHYIDYNQLTDSAIVPALRQSASLAGTLSGSTWTITRQGAGYTVSVSACIYDDPRDGVAAHPAGYGFCSTSPSTSSYNATTGDSNPDDFRRVDVTIGWRSQGGRAHQLQQSVLIVNPSGGLGPRITGMTPAQLLVQDGGSPSCSQPACVSIPGTSTQAGPITVTTATPAQSLHWNADDGISGDSLTGPATSFQINWPLGDLVTGVLDGLYTLTAQAFDDRAVPGDLKASTVLINRRVPFAPTEVQGGWDTRLCAPSPAVDPPTAVDQPCSSDVVDIQWKANRERDVIGYHVYYLAADGTKVPVTCTVNGAQQTLVKGTYCLDQSPPSRSTVPTPTYVIAAVDQTDIANPGSAPRDGDTTPVGVAAADRRPYFPAETTTAGIQSGAPTITWSADAVAQDTGSNPRILFYRIYRDPPSTSPLPLSARYDITATTARTYSDPNPGSSTSHTYWVTAVDDKFNESAPLGPFQTP